MGQIVLVVRAERTSHAQLRQALAAIEANPVKMLLLNGARQHASQGYRYAADRAAPRSQAYIL
jgi:receptor protein-tyrosine kinase